MHLCQKKDPDTQLPGSKIIHDPHPVRRFFRIRDANQIG